MIRLHDITTALNYSAGDIQNTMDHVGFPITFRRSVDLHGGAPETDEELKSFMAGLRYRSNGIMPRLQIDPQNITGADLLAARKRAGITQSEAARLMCRSVRSYQDAEKGITDIDPATAYLFLLRIGAVRLNQLP